MSTDTPTRILVAIDFGAASAAAVRLAGRLAPALGATLSAVHAETVEAPAYFTHDQLSELERQVREARSRAADEARAFVEQLTAVPVAVSVVDGPAAEAILQAAHGAALVVMGTHGRRGPARWWLGSVAERVVREATVPVLVVHAADEGGAAGVASVLLTASSEGDAAARLWAERLAGALGVPVMLGPVVEQCDSAQVQGAAALVVPVPPRQGHRAVHEAAVALARTCSRPVLFVPVAAA